MACAACKFGVAKGAANSMAPISKVCSVRLNLGCECLSLRPLRSKPVLVLARRSGGVVFSTVAAPEILSEDVFRGLGRFDEEDDEDELEYEEESDEDGELSVSGDELAIKKLGLPERLVESLAKRGIQQLFPIQRAVLIPALEGRDIIARAKTGTGKTLAFGIPILKQLTEDYEKRSYQRRSGRLPRVLVLAPTRELAKQVENEIKDSAPYLSTVCVYGGVSYTSQQAVLHRGVDVVVGTPGRLIDLIKSNTLQLEEVQFLVLDEADQMLAVGFEEDVEVILERLPLKRQSMLFSATLPAWVSKLARKYLDKPLTIDLVGNRDEKLAEGIKLYALSAATSNAKRIILNDLITVYGKGRKTIVFTKTRRDADQVSLTLANTIASEPLHGDITQYQRQRTLNDFREGKFTVLVATDVAARGLDITNVDLVIHYELPNDAETFVHRSGRTVRAGKEGTCILMFTGSERRTVKSLERDVGCKFEYIGSPSMEEVLESSAEQVFATLKGVHRESVEYFLPSAKKMLEEQGAEALAAALAQLSGFSRPPSSRSLITLEQGWMTLQLIRDPSLSKGYMSARAITGFLSDVYSAAADKVGKIHMIADERVQGAVFDLPEEIAKELMNREIPPGNTVSRITKLPSIQDDGPVGGNYGCHNQQGGNGGRPQGRRGDSRSSNSRGIGRNSSDGGDFRGGASRFKTQNSWSGRSRTGGGDGFIGGSSCRPNRSGSRDRSGFDGSCFKCGRSGHKASDCPRQRDY